MVDQIEDFVLKSVSRLRRSFEFNSWLKNKEPANNDIILVNNSFVFRDVKTNKSRLCLALPITEWISGTAPMICSGLKFNSNLKNVSRKSSNLANPYPLKDAIESQIDQIGHLVFLLIGEVRDTEIVRAELNVKGFSEVLWNPELDEDAIVDNDQIIVKRTDDEEAIWTAVESHFLNGNLPVPENLRETLGFALDKLQDQAVANVQIPDAGQQFESGITDAIVEVLKGQRTEYLTALKDCQNGKQSIQSLNEILRISYNFASDATGFLRLIVSICDLKPIILWGTIAEHFALAIAFENLPWARSRRKPSLKNYQQAIADARNSAFHNLFPFRKSLKIPLPETALGTPELRIFSEYSKKGENQLTYQDKALVDVLVEFTRARERRLSIHFWQKNLEVMNATISLFQSTSQFLKLLSRARAA